MAEQLLTSGEIKERELLMMNLAKAREEIGAALLVNCCK